MAPTTPPGSLAYSPATMSVKSKPFFTDFRCTWLGSVAKPTYCLSISWGGGQGQGWSGVCWGSWAAPCPVPYPAEEKVGRFNGRKRVKACGQRPGGGRAGHGLAGEGTLVSASASFAGTQDCVSVCVYVEWDMSGLSRHRRCPSCGVDRRHKNGDPSDMPLSSQAGEAQASVLTPP